MTLLTYKDALKEEFGLKFPCSDLGNMERFIEQWGRLLRYIPETQQWIKFEHDTGWQVIKNEILMICADATIESLLIEATTITGNKEGKNKLLRWAIESGNGNHRSKMLENVSEDYRMVVHIEDFDKVPHEISCLNGILDLKTLKLRGFTPKDMTLKRVAVAYDPDAKCPLWLKTLAEIFPLDGNKDGDTETISYLQRSLNYAATGEMKEEKVFFCTGLGINGKGTVFETVMHAFGDYAGFTDFGMITSKRDNDTIVLGARAGLVGKRFAWADESQSNEWVNEAKLKQTTNPWQRAKLLYKDAFPFPAQYTLFLTTNHLPKIKAHDKGTWRRVSVFQFLQDFETRNDHNLKDNLKKEAEGIFAWIVAGGWYEKRLGSVPKSIQKAIDDYRRDNDYIGPFWDTWMEYDPARGKKAGTYSTEIHDKYVVWAIGNKFEPASHSDFGRWSGERGRIEGKGEKFKKAFYYGWFIRETPKLDEEITIEDVEETPTEDKITYIEQELTPSGASWKEVPPKAKKDKQEYDWENEFAGY